MPESVILEITKSCNFACTMCSSRTGGFLPAQTMTPAFFRELVRVFGAGAKCIRVNGYARRHRFLGGGLGFWGCAKTSK